MRAGRRLVDGTAPHMIARCCMPLGRWVDGTHRGKYVVRLRTCAPAKPSV